MMAYSPSTATAAPAYTGPHEVNTKIDEALMEPACDLIDLPCAARTDLGGACSFLCDDDTGQEFPSNGHHNYLEEVSTTIGAAYAMAIDNDSGNPYHAALMASNVAGGAQDPLGSQCQ